MLDYGEYRWQTLGALDARRVASELGEAFVEHAALPRDQPLVRLLEAMAARHRSMGGNLLGLRWIIFDETGACGWTGLVGRPDGVWETATYLHPRVWGSGLNLLCKSLLWQLSSELAGRAELEISIDAANLRSVRANRRLFPASEMYTGSDLWRGRISTVIVADRAPVGYLQLDAAQLDVAREIVESSAAQALGRA